LRSSTEISKGGRGSLKDLQDTDKAAVSNGEKEGEEHALQWAHAAQRGGVNLKGSGRKVPSRGGREDKSPMLTSF